jgi:hypothetical protein
LAVDMTRIGKSLHALGLVLSVAVAILLPACVAEPLHNGPIDDQRAAKLELICTKLKLPAPLHNVWLYQNDKWVFNQKIRFETSTAAARAFATALLRVEYPELGRGAYHRLTPGYDPGIHLGGPSVDWWLKDFPHNAEGGEFHYPPRRIVVFPKGDSATVWLWLSQDTSNIPVSACGGQIMTTP